MDLLTEASRRHKVDSASAEAQGRSHAEVLQIELSRREAALIAAHADNERLRENVSEQLKSKRTLRQDLQVRLSINDIGIKTEKHKIIFKYFHQYIVGFGDNIWIAVN